MSTRTLSAVLALVLVFGFVAPVSAYAAPQAVVQVVDTDIEAIDNGSARPEQAVAEITVDITAIDGPIFLNGDQEKTLIKRFFQPKVYGAGSSASTTVTAVTHSLSGHYSIVNAGKDNEYYVVPEGDTVRITVTMVISQAVGTRKAVRAGVTVNTMKYGIASTTDTSRSTKTFDLKGIRPDFKTGTVLLANPS